MLKLLNNLNYKLYKIFQSVWGLFRNSEPSLPGELGFEPRVFWSKTKRVTATPLPNIKLLYSKSLYKTSYF